MPAMHFTNENFEAEVLKSDKPVLVDFWAEWCGPCKMIGPIINEVADEMAAKVKVGKVDVDEASDVAGKYGIMSIPTLIIFKNGEIVEKMVGALPKDQLIAKLNKVLG